MSLGKFLASALVLSAMSVHADVYEYGKGALEFESNSPEVIETKVIESMKIACRGDQCTLYSTTTHNKGWSIDVFAGEGNPNQNVNGSTPIVVIGTDGKPIQDNEPQPYAGIRVRYSDEMCTQAVNGTKALYEVSEKYKYSLLNDDGTPRNNLTEAQKMFLYFQANLLAVLKGCSNGGMKGGGSF